MFCRIKHYEAKLATLTVINGALQQENDQLKEEAESYGVHEDTSKTARAEQELAELQEEFTKRLGVAEKTVRRYNLEVYVGASFEGVRLYVVHSARHRVFAQSRDPFNPCLSKHVLPS